MGRVFRAVVLGMLATQGLEGQAPERAAPPRPAYRGGVNLVTLNVSVTDRSRRYVRTSTSRISSSSKMAGRKR